MATRVIRATHILPTTMCKAVPFCIEICRPPTTNAAIAQIAWSGIGGWAFRKVDSTWSTHINWNEQHRFSLRQSSPQCDFCRYYWFMPFCQSACDWGVTGVWPKSFGWVPCSKERHPQWGKTNTDFTKLDSRVGLLFFIVLYGFWCFFVFSPFLIEGYDKEQSHGDSRSRGL